MKSNIFQIITFFVFYLSLSAHSQYTIQIDFSDFPQPADSQCVFNFDFDSIYHPIYDRYYEFILPPDADMKNVRYSLYDTTKTTINKYLRACPYDRLRILTPDEITKNKQIAELFTKLDEFITSENVFFFHTDMLWHYKTATIGISPIRYNPLKNQLEILHKGTLTIHFNVIPDFPCDQKRILSSEQELKSRVVNDTAIFELYEPCQSSSRQPLRAPNSSIGNESILFLGEKLRLHPGYQGVNKQIEVFTVSGKLIQKVITTDNIVSINYKSNSTTQMILLAKIVIIP